MSGKFYIKDVGKWTDSFDNFVDAETAAKKRRSHSNTDDTLMIVQGIATVQRPVDAVFTTVL